LNDQSARAVAIGYLAGSTSQSTNSVAIGSQSGNNRQGEAAVAIGIQSCLNDQSAHAVAIGYLAGQLVQGESTVAIGTNAGENSQQANAIAIGTSAGQTDQGKESICIGLKTEAENVNNSIALGSGAVADKSNLLVINLNGTPGPFKTFFETESVVDQPVDTFIYVNINGTTYALMAIKVTNAPQFPF
jgi:hypothetical protein